MDFWMYHTVINLVAYFSFLSITYKSTPKAWTNKDEKFDVIFVLAIMPILMLIPIINLILWGCIILDYRIESKKLKRNKAIESEEKIKELDNFAYEFGTMIYNSKLVYRTEELCDIYKKYSLCKTKVLRLKQLKYTTIHNIHNKKGEEFFYRTMGLIKECYNNNTIELCSSDILKSLIVLAETLQAQLVTYEREYNVEQDTANEVYSSRFSKLQDELKITNEFEKAYQKQTQI